MVLQLSTFHWEGGAGVAAARLHQALLKTGVDSQLMVSKVSAPGESTTSVADSPWKEKIAWANFVSERLQFLPNERDATIRFAFSPALAGTDISEHPLVKQASIIHLHWINFGFLSLEDLEKLFALGKPVIWTLHDLWTFTGGCHYNRGCDNYLSHCRYCPYLRSPGEYDISFDQFEKKRLIYENTSLTLVSPSGWLDHQVKKATLTRDMASLSIPNCIDTDLFKPTNTGEARIALGLPSDKKLILFAGANTQDPRKGFSYFQQALAKLDIPDLEVMIFGKGRAENFEQMPVNVHFLGKITDPAQMVNAYNAADMIVVPSLEDNLPNTVMEAMSCGTPAVGFDTGGIPEMIDHLDNGFVSVARSAESIAEGVRWVFEQNSNHSVSRKAREKVLRSYSEKVVATRYSQLYQTVLHG